MSLLAPQLCAISFLDALSLGLFHPLQTPHFSDIGGTAINLGLYGSLYTIGYHASDSIIGSAVASVGQRMYLLISLVITLVTMFPLIFINNVYLAILLRLAYVLTNKTRVLCKEILTGSDDETDIIDYSSILGYAFGATLAGFLFEAKNFRFVAQISAAAILVACLLAQLLQDGNPQINDIEVMPALKEQMSNFQETIKGVDFEIVWDVALIKFLYTMSISLFLAKFSFILQHNFKVNYAVIGYTYAFHYVSAFLSSYTSQYLSERFNINYSSNLIFITFAVLFIIHAPTYEVYLLLIIAYMALTTLLKTTWLAVIETRGVTPEQDEAIGVLSECISPMLLGMFCQACDVYGFIDLVTMPLIIASSLLIFHTSLIIEKIKKDQREEEQAAAAT